VLYQTMYLVATSMGLAPCGLGNGDTELYCRAAGTAYHVESSVGEFMLGSLPEGFAYPPRTGSDLEQAAGAADVEATLALADQIRGELAGRSLGERAELVAEDRAR
jgi:hypothetical protein